MTLFEAPPYNPRREKRKKVLLVSVLIAIPVFALLTWYFWNWPEEHRVNRLFAAIERKDFPGAFSIWNNDLDWRQHPERYKGYPYGQFELDWGPASEWGTITRHSIEASLSRGSGVILAIKINGRTEDAFLILNKKDKTIGFSPVELQIK